MRGWLQGKDIMAEGHPGGKLLGSWQPGSREEEDGASDRWGSHRHTPRDSTSSHFPLAYSYCPMANSTDRSSIWTDPLSRSVPSQSVHLPTCPPLDLAAFLEDQAFNVGALVGDIPGPNSIIKVRH